MQESILTDIDQDVKERINYLVYKKQAAQKADNHARPCSCI